MHYLSHYIECDNTCCIDNTNGNSSNTVCFYVYTYIRTHTYVYTCIYLSIYLSIYLYII